MVRRAERAADWAGPFGAVFAALCCLGVQWVVAAVTAVGLGFLRSDAILWPLMIASILLAWWGIWTGHRAYGSRLPLCVGLLSGSALIAGVIFVRGFPARELIYAGSAGLVFATVINAVARNRSRNSPPFIS